MVIRKKSPLGEGEQRCKGPEVAMSVVGYGSKASSILVYHVKGQRAKDEAAHVRLQGP